MLARLARAARWIAGGLVGAVAIFLLTAWIGAAIPRNGNWEEPDDGVTIYLGSNGVHTEIAMPIATETMDWRDHFPLDDLRDPDRGYTHVAVSWGERSFFLETPTWSDFDPLTAASALAGGDALLHMVFYVRPKASPEFRSLTIRRDEYERLVRRIVADIPDANSRKTHPGYGKNDAFYTAKGSYHIGNTCNQWTSDRLAEAGIRTGWWTPLPGGVMQWATRD